MAHNPFRSGVAVRGPRDSWRSLFSLKIVPGIRLLHSTTVSLRPIVDSAPAPTTEEPISKGPSPPQGSAVNAESRLTRLLKDVTGRGDSSLLARLRPHSWALAMGCVAWALAVRNLRDKTAWKDREEKLVHDAVVLQDRLDLAGDQYAHLHTLLANSPPSWSAAYRERVVSSSVTLGQLLSRSNSSDPAPTLLHVPQSRVPGQTGERPTTLF